MFQYDAGAVVQRLRIVPEAVDPSRHRREDRRPGGQEDIHPEVDGPAFRHFIGVQRELPGGVDLAGFVVPADPRLGPGGRHAPENLPGQIVHADRSPQQGPVRAAHAEIEYQGGG